MAGVSAPVGPPELEDLVQGGVLTWLPICAVLVGSRAGAVGWRPFLSLCTSPRTAWTSL